MHQKILCEFTNIPYTRNIFHVCKDLIRIFLRCMLDNLPSKIFFLRHCKFRKWSKDISETFLSFKFVSNSQLSRFKYNSNFFLYKFRLIFLFHFYIHLCNQKLFWYQESFILFKNKIKKLDDFYYLYIFLDLLKK